MLPNYRQMLEYSKIANIKEYILNEAVDKNKASAIILLSNLDEDSYTAPEIEKSCKAKNIKYRLIDINTCKLSKADDFYIIDDVQTKPFKINPNTTGILARRGVVRNTFTQDVMITLETMGFFVINTLEAIIKCENKFTTSKVLEENGILIPKMALLPSVEAIEESLDEIGGTFPIILKLLSGTQGVGVSIVDSIESLKSVMQTMWKIDPDAEVLIQEKIDADYDIRIQVLNKWNNLEHSHIESEIIGSMRRNKVEKDFRTNYSLGGSVGKVKLTKEQEDIAIKASRILDCSWCGVDIMVDKNDGKNYVIEVNASPGTKGLKKATGINVVSDIVNYLEDRRNWVQRYTVVGFREWITVEGVGDIVAKFDTGNGAIASSMLYDKMDVDEKKKIVHWTLGKKKFSNEFLGWSNVEVGPGESKRPIIKMDITFNGRTVYDVEVGLNNNRETKSTKFLVNRKLMRQFGCSVDPSKDFLIKPYEGDFVPLDAKKDPHYGIIFNK